MNNFEFVSYKPTPTDQYCKGIVTVRIDKKYIVRYAERLTKTGGIFFSVATHSHTENGQKKYEAGFMFDSRMEDELLLDFIRFHVNATKRQHAAVPINQGPICYPHGLCQTDSQQSGNSGQFQEPPDLFSGTQEPDQMPF